MKSFKLIPYRINDAVLMVSSYQEGAISGWLAHSRLNGPQPIQSIPQLIFLLDDLLSQEDAQIRYHAFESVPFESIPRIATLRLQILFREHHTWQGCVIWEEAQKEASFLSVLELIQILDEILST